MAYKGADAHLTDVAIVHTTVEEILGSTDALCPSILVALARDSNSSGRITTTNLTNSEHVLEQVAVLHSHVTSNTYNTTHILSPVTTTSE
jgi:hypothetical protein